MLRPRVIPVLTLRGAGLVKTEGFRDPRYVGDPLNAIRIFNEKEVDELLVIDLAATVENRAPQFTRLRHRGCSGLVVIGLGGQGERIAIQDSRSDR